MLDLVSCTSILLLVGIALLSACNDDDDGCDLDVRVTKLAGGGVDCGRVAIGASSAATDACILHALSTHAAFHATYQEQGTDSPVDRGYAGTADGRVFVLLRDGDPSGGGGSHAVIDQSECIGPGPASGSSSTSPVDRTAPIVCASSSAVSRVCD